MDDRNVYCFVVMVLPVWLVVRWQTVSSVMSQITVLCTADKTNIVSPVSVLIISNLSIQRIFFRPFPTDVIIMGIDEVDINVTCIMTFMWLWTVLLFIDAQTVHRDIYSVSVWYTA